MPPFVRMPPPLVRYLSPTRGGILRWNTPDKFVKNNYFEWFIDSVITERVNEFRISFSRNF